MVSIFELTSAPSIIKAQFNIDQLIWSVYSRSHHLTTQPAKQIQTNSTC